MIEERDDSGREDTAQGEVGKILRGTPLSMLSADDDRRSSPRIVTGPIPAVPREFTRKTTGSSRSSMFATASAWIRRRRDARKRPPEQVASSILDQITQVTPIEGFEPSVLVIVAHPDDEAIGAGSVLRGVKNATVVHVTDGAPNSEEYAQRKGFATRADYARQRRSEVVAALRVIGLPEDRIIGLGFVDGEASWHLVDLCHRVADLFMSLRPDVVLTHPYEGGHSDHDSTAFAVHLAAGILQRDGLAAPIILELTSYHNYQGRRRLFEFLPWQGASVRTRKLTDDDRAVKRQMFEAFTSQRALLETFPIQVERFRQAPRYLFTVPPHEGELDYERLCKQMTGAQWRVQASNALQLLRSKRQFNGV